MLPLHEQSDPPTPGPAHYVRRLKAGLSMTPIVLSTAIWGCWTHWGDQRSSPHHKEKATCPGCKRGFPLRWKGYVHIYNPENHSQEFLELTPLMARQMLDQAGPGAPLRGQRFCFSRGKGDKARCSVNLAAHYAAFKTRYELPAEKDPKPVLLELWGLSNVTFGDGPEDVLPFQEAI